MIKKELNDIYRKQIISWKYPQPYDIYQLPSMEDMKEKKYRFIDPLKQDEYVVYIDENNTVIGYVSRNIQDYYVFLGIGVNPVFCNQGYGQRIIAQEIKDIQKTYQELKLCMKVRCWNQRAIHVYEKLGFEIKRIESIKTMTDIDKFYIMEYKGESHE